MTASYDHEHLRRISTLMRHWILRSTTRAGSGDPASSLSAVELTVDPFFGGHSHYDVDNPAFPNNDRLIFSEGHASPLLYPLWAAAGQISEEELMTYRQVGRRLESCSMNKESRPALSSRK